MKLSEEYCEGWCFESGGKGKFTDCTGCQIHKLEAQLKTSQYDASEFQRLFKIARQEKRDAEKQLAAANEKLNLLQENPISDPKLVAQLAAVRDAISKQFTNSKHISYSQEYEAVADFANELLAAIGEVE